MKLARSLKIGNKKIGEAYQNQLKNNPERAVRAVAYADEMERAVAAKNNGKWRELYAILKKFMPMFPK